MESFSNVTFLVLSEDCFDVLVVWCWDVYCFFPTMSVVLELIEYLDLCCRQIFTFYHEIHHHQIPPFERIFRIEESRTFKAFRSHRRAVITFLPGYLLLKKGVIISYPVMWGWFHMPLCIRIPVFNTILKFPWCICRPSGLAWKQTLSFEGQWQYEHTGSTATFRPSFWHNKSLVRVYQGVFPTQWNKDEKWPSDSDDFPVVDLWFSALLGWIISGKNLGRNEFGSSLVSGNGTPAILGFHQRLGEIFLRIWPQK